MKKKAFDKKLLNRRWSISNFYLVFQQINMTTILQYFVIINLSSLVFNKREEIANFLDFSQSNFKLVSLLFHVNAI